MIASYRDKETEKVATGIRVKKLEAIALSAQKRLMAIEAATRLEDLQVPPGNHLEALKGDRQGQHSIRINDQYRICFEWKEGKAHNVEITDYH
jgi:proteic killer suppression protein